MGLPYLELKKKLSNNDKKLRIEPPGTPGWYAPQKNVWDFCSLWSTFIKYVLGPEDLLYPALGWNMPKDSEFGTFGIYIWAWRGRRTVRLLTVVGEPYHYSHQLTCRSDHTPVEDPCQKRCRVPHEVKDQFVETSQSSWSLLALGCI